MAAGLVSHNITTATGVTFGVISWVPDTGAPDVGAVPVARITDGTNVAPVSATNGVKVDVAVLPALPAGGNNIGDVDVLTLPALPAGTNNIGDVDVITVPADPFGVNADAANVAGSVSAKLRALATAIGTGVITRGAGASDSTTLRVSIASEQVDRGHYVPCAASSTTTLTHPTGGTGAAGDFLASILVVPGSLSPGPIEIKDSSGGTAIRVFEGGTNSLSNLSSFTLNLGYTSNAGPWQVLTGSLVKCVAGGGFSA